MKKVLLVTLLCSILFITAARAGEPFPDLRLEGQMPTVQASYLGITEKEPRLSDIRAGYILVEIMSMYCPICQREASLVNKIFQTLDDRGFSDRIKMIAIGAGNSQFEINFFRNKYSVAMPMFTDQNYVAHKALGNVGTPFFILVKKHENGTLETLYAHEGGIEDGDAFLATVLQKAGYGG